MTIKSPYELLREIICELKVGGVCLLHGYQELRNSIPSDVDVILSDSALCDFTRMHFSRWPLVQIIQHEISCYYFIFSSWGISEPKYLLFDVATDYRRNGCVFYEGAEILARSTVNVEGLPIPAPDHEFGYYLVKKIAKGDLQSVPASHLSELWRRNPEGCRAQLCRFFPPSVRRLIEHAAGANDWAEVLARKRAIRRSMLVWNYLRAPFGSLGYWGADFRRLIGRCLRPTGLIVCVLGPDGAGKSTVLDASERRLAPAFRRTRRYHLRYERARVDPARPVTDPHGKAPYGLMLSVAKLAYLLGIYWAGYLVHGLPRKIRSTLILFDRYYHDLIVDPKRYRYGGPLGLAHLVSRLMPRPDLFLVLDAPSEVLQSRKREVPLEETARQRQAYLSFAAATSNARIINASQPIESVIADANAAVLDFMAERTAGRLRRLKIG